MVALRYSYLSTLPLAVLGGGLLAVGLDRTRARIRIGELAASGVLVGLLVLGTHQYLPVFHDATALWTRALEVEPGCVVCGEMLLHDGILAHRGRFRYAEAGLRAALARDPALQETRWQLGMIALIQTERAAGEAYFRDYLRVIADRDPDYIPRIAVVRREHIAMAHALLEQPALGDRDALQSIMTGLAGAR